MTIVDMTNWKFEFSNTSRIDELCGIQTPPTILNLVTSADLVRYIADDDQDDYTRMQTRIDERIDADPVARSWKKARTPLKSLKHFPRYRAKKFDVYHTAARAAYDGSATAEEQQLVDGLQAEVDASRIIVPAGQVLFHGRADRGVTKVTPYLTFISTSLNPVVARMSAFRRTGLNQANGRPTVYILTLRCPLPGLWGQTGSSVEYELLLPRLLVRVQRSEYSGRNFDVIEADVQSRA